MRKSIKIALIVTGCVVLALAISAAVSVWLWRIYSPDLIDGAKNANKLGAQEGKELAEAQCLERALQRHRLPENLGIVASLKNNLRLRGCFDASRISAEFCTDVPAAGSIVDAGLWGAKRCAQEGFFDSYCGNLFQQVDQYCNSKQRENKLRTHAATEPAAHR